MLLYTIPKILQIQKRTHNEEYPLMVIYVFQKTVLQDTLHGGWKPSFFTQFRDDTIMVEQCNPKCKMTLISGSNIQHFIICITVWDTTCHDFKNTRLNYHFETKLCHSQLTINQWCSESCNPPLVALAPTKKGYFHRKMGKQKRKLSLIYTNRNVVPAHIIICFEHMP